MQDVIKTEAQAAETICPVRPTFLSQSGTMTLNHTPKCEGGKCALWIWRHEETQRAYERRKVLWAASERPAPDTMPTEKIVGYEPITDIIDYKAQGYKLEADWAFDEEDRSRQWRRWVRPYPNRQGACSYAVNAHANATRPSGTV